MLHTWSLFHTYSLLFKNMGYGFFPAFVSSLAFSNTHLSFATQQNICIAFKTFRTTLLMTLYPFFLVVLDALTG